MNKLSRFGLVVIMILLILCSYFQDSFQRNVFQKIDVAIEKGDILAALVYLNYQIKKDSSQEALFLRAQCFYTQLRFDESLQDIKILKDKGYADLQVTYLEMQNRAALGDTLNVISILDAVANKTDDNKLALQFRTESGRLLFYLKQYEEAYKRFSSNFIQNDALSYYYAGVALRYQSDNAGSAIKDSLIDQAKIFLEKSISLDSSNSDAWCQMALIKNYSGDNAAGLQLLNKAIEIDDDNYIYYFYRGNLLYALGKCKSALEDYDKALHLYPDADDIYTQREKLKLECFNGTSL